MHKSRDITYQQQAYTRQQRTKETTNRCWGIQVVEWLIMRKCKKVVDLVTEFIREGTVRRAWNSYRAGYIRSWSYSNRTRVRERVRGWTGHLRRSPCRSWVVINREGAVSLASQDNPNHRWTRSRCRSSQLTRYWNSSWGIAILKVTRGNR